MAVVLLLGLGGQWTMEECGFGKLVKKGTKTNNKFVVIAAYSL